MTYWAETMQDDLYLIAADGWQASSDLVPASLVITRYFAAEQEAIAALEAEREAIGRRWRSWTKNTAARGPLGRGQEREGQAHQGRAQGPCAGDLRRSDAADELAV